MIFSTAQRVNYNTIVKPVVIEGNTVEEVHEFKYLGILLDRHLTFKPHAAYLRRKVFAKLKVLGRVRQYVSQNLSLYMYKSLILPEFDYGDQIYDAMCTTTSKQLQIIQNSCLRICTRANKGTSITDLHTMSGVPTLDVRRKVHTCNFVNKGLQGQSSAGVNKMLKYRGDNSVVATRSSDNGSVQVSRCRLKLTGGNIAIRGAKYFNELPPPLRLEVDCAKFNKDVKAQYYGQQDRGVT